MRAHADPHLISRSHIQCVRFLMGKRKRKLTAAEKAEKRRRRELYQTVFIGGRMKRVRRPPTVDGMDAEEFIRRNADPVWLHQNEMWEHIPHDPPGDDDSPF